MAISKAGNDHTQKQRRKGKGEGADPAFHVLCQRGCQGMVSRPLNGQCPYPVQFTHMPAFLSPKQYQELYWPYQQKVIDWAAKQNSKVIMLMEGKWENNYDCFLSAPRDSCVLVADEDDIFTLHDRLGQHQILIDGVKLLDTRMDNAEKAIDNGKRVIDHCAPGGGFILTTDKAWVTPGDINHTLVDVMNSLHNYSRK